MIIEVVNRDYLQLHQLAIPIEPVKTLIEYFYQKYENDAEGILLPHVGFSIVFNLEGSYFLQIDQTRYKIDDHVILPRNKSISSKLHKSHIFGIRFKSSYLSHLFNVSPRFFKKPLTIDHFISKPFIEAIENAANFEERTQLCNRYFTQVLEKIRKKLWMNNLVHEVMAEIQDRSFMDSSISSLSKSKFLSNKTLGRYFMQTVGVTPKQAFCIYRVRKGLDLYVHNRDRLNKFDLGYYDYSHFYREVANVTGLTLPQFSIPLKA
jgi:hypothetical protein